MSLSFSLLFLAQKPAAEKAGWEQSHYEEFQFPEFSG
jgi:hypothetical protein